MPMYWTFNCFLGCIYTVYCIVYIVVLVLNWLSNLEFWLPKKEDQVARIGVMGGGFRWFGQCPKENVFLPLTPSLMRFRQKKKKLFYDALLPLMFFGTGICLEMFGREERLLQLLLVCWAEKNVLRVSEQHRGNLTRVSWGDYGAGRLGREHDLPNLGRLQCWFVH